MTWSAGQSVPPSMPQGQHATVFPCPHCYAALPMGTLVCGTCHRLVYAGRLDQIAREAMHYEQFDHARAALVWRQALELLPQGSPEYINTYNRIGALAAGYGMHIPAPGGRQPSTAAEAPAPNDSLPVALFKTIGSMAISVVVYTLFFAAGSRSGNFTSVFWFAVGFVLLILVHEMGHVIAIRKYGMRASAPIFIPFIGALINLREQPKNAWQEAVIGIGGPLLGTLGALVCYGLFLRLHDPAMVNVMRPFLPQSEQWARLFLLLSGFGFLLNLFNMLPVPPLDGGRITAGVSVWAWVLGLLAFVGLIVRGYYMQGRVSIIMLIVLFMALPRVMATLRKQERQSPYYQIGGQRRLLMGVLYVGLTALLVISYLAAQYQLLSLEGIRLL